MKAKKLHTTILFVLLCSYTWAVQIGSVSFSGLTKTKESFLSQLVKCKPGMTFNQEVFDQDIQILKNLNLFFGVDGEVIEKGDLVDLNFVIQEAKYVYPIFSIGGFDDQFKLQIGANNINWRGKGQTIGGYYQYYDRHSFNIYQTTPRHRNNKTGHEISIGKYSTVEPLYFEGATSDFNFDNYSLSIGGHYWITQKWKAGVGGMVMHENYLKLDENFQDLPIGSNFKFFKYQIRGAAEYNGVNQHFELRKGVKLKLYAENIETKGYPEASFFKFIEDFTAFYHQFGRSNFGIHQRFGIATNNYSPFSPFVLDGFINVRGIGNRVIRGTAEMITNLEYRYSFLKHQYVILQGVAFTDIGMIRLPGNALSSMLENDHSFYYGGIGLRAHLRVFYNSIFRFDYGWNLENPKEGGFTFGVSQFF